jgi:glycosyltransferase involved in cell wall biosynthesis
MPPARILIFTQFYPPEATAGSNRVSAVARALAQAGEDVTVVTGRPSFPDGVIPPAYRGRGGADERDGQVRVRRVWTYASPRLRTVDRVANWLSVAVGALWYVLTRREPVDIVLVSTPPITLALPALAGALRHRARLVLDVRDVYPEIAVKLGVWKRESLLTRVVSFVSEQLYRKASVIFAMTRTAAQEIGSHGVASEKIVVAPNGFDRVASVAQPFVQRSNGEFVIAYAGNMGVATGMHVVLDAAGQLEPAADYQFLLVGGGSECGDVAQRIEREQLDNVTLLGAQPREIAAAIVRDADVSLVPLKRGVDDCVPTKLFDALAQGTPVIVCADGEARFFVELSGGGIVVPPEDGRALAHAIRELAADRSRGAALGRSGKAYVLANYDRATVVSDIVQRVSALSSA